MIKDLLGFQPHQTLDHDAWADDADVIKRK